MKVMPMTIFILLLITLNTNSKTITISSTLAMKRLLKTQASVIVSLKNIMPEIMKTQRHTVEKFLITCEKEHAKAMKKVADYLNNPINAYTLIKRLSSDLSYVEKRLKKTNYIRTVTIFSIGFIPDSSSLIAKIAQRKIKYMFDMVIYEVIGRSAIEGEHHTANTNLAYKRTAKMLYPKITDLQNAKFAFNSLTITYRLKVSQLANGILESNYSNTGKTFTEYVTPMTSSDCYELALSAYQQGDIDISLAWIKKAYQKYHENCHDDCPFTESDMLLFVTKLCYQADNHISTRYWLLKSSNFTKNNNKKEHKLLTSYFKTIYEEQLQSASAKNNSYKLQRISEFSKDEQGNHSGFGNFSLCTGGQIVQTGLYCQYRYGPHPFLRLARFKTELLHAEPDVIMFHDVISDDEITIVKKLSVLKFSDAMIHGEVTEPELGVRMGQTSFLYDDESDTVAAISRRVVDISGQDPDSTVAEGLQVAYYGPGGFYLPHYDSVLDWTPEDDQGVSFGHRRSTTLFYLSEENQGGATIFCELGLTVFPKKNSAIFWKNLLLDGMTDEKTLHGGCPVLHGSKWVATKWLSDSEAKVLLSKITYEIE